MRINGISTTNWGSPVSRFFDLLSVKKVVKVALIAIAVNALTAAPKAEANIGAWTICMGICLASTGGAFLPMCAEVCVAALASPI